MLKTLQHLLISLKIPAKVLIIAHAALIHQTSHRLFELTFLMFTHFQPLCSPGSLITLRLQTLVLLQTPSLISLRFLFLSTNKLLLRPNFLRHPVDCISSLCCSVLSRSVMSNSLQPYGLYPTSLLCPWGILQAIAKCIAMPSSKVSSRPRNRTLMSSALGGRFFTTSATWEPLTAVCPVPKTVLGAE